MSSNDPNADRERIAATRAARQRAEFLANVGSSHLREITVSCTSDGDSFAQLQTTPQKLSSAITRLAVVRVVVDELESLLTEIDADWSQN